MGWIKIPIRKDGDFSIPAPRIRYAHALRSSVIRSACSTNSLTLNAPQAPPFRFASFASLTFATLTGGPAPLPPPQAAQPLRSCYAAAVRGCAYPRPCYAVAGAA